MAAIALAFDDVGLAVPVQEVLENAGHSVVWAAHLALGPKPGQLFDAVIMKELPGNDLTRLAEAWRNLEPPPALVLVGVSDRAKDFSALARVPMVPSNAPPEEIAQAVGRAMPHRFTGKISLGFARGALGLPKAHEQIGDCVAVVNAGRKVAVDLIKEALKWHVHKYVTAVDSMVAQLRELRALQVPEIEFVKLLDGTRTVRSLVNVKGPDPAWAARVVWTLLSVDAARMSDEPPDLTTPERRLVAMTRAHLRAREKRVRGVTYYDVLEVSRDATAQDIDTAARLLALRFSPDRMNGLDLADAAPLVQPIWEQILKARATLRDINQRALYDNKLNQLKPPPATPWWGGPYDVTKAEYSFQRGQKYILEGEAFRSVSEMAAAARAFPDHPDYETSLAWARFRAEVARGRDKMECAQKERAVADSVVLGRRPWPRALVAIAMLCAATGDPESARWYLREALACDPNLPAAQQLLQRLSRSPTAHT